MEQYVLQTSGPPSETVWCIKKTSRQLPETVAVLLGGCLYLAVHELFEIAYRYEPEHKDEHGADRAKQHQLHGVRQRRRVAGNAEAQRCHQHAEAHMRQKPAGIERQFYDPHGGNEEHKRQTRLCGQRCDGAADGIVAGYQHIVQREVEDNPCRGDSVQRLHTTIGGEQCRVHIHDTPCRERQHEDGEHEAVTFGMCGVDLALAIQQVHDVAAIEPCRYGRYHRYWHHHVHAQPGYGLHVFLLCQHAPEEGQQHGGEHKTEDVDHIQQAEGSGPDAGLRLAIGTHTLYHNSIGPVIDGHQEDEQRVRKAVAHNAHDLGHAEGEAELHLAQPAQHYITRHGSNEVAHDLGDDEPLYAEHGSGGRVQQQEAADDDHEHAVGDGQYGIGLEAVQGGHIAADERQQRIERVNEEDARQQGEFPAAVAQHKTPGAGHQHIEEHKHQPCRQHGRKQFLQPLGMAGDGLAVVIADAEVEDGLENDAQTEQRLVGTVGSSGYGILHGAVYKKYP